MTSQSNKKIEYWYDMGTVKKIDYLCHATETDNVLEIKYKSEILFKLFTKGLLAVTVLDLIQKTLKGRFNRPETSHVEVNLPTKFGSTFDIGVVIHRK